ncbi:MAG: hypothetical protein AAF684_00265 [Pseudomonadota bacterium]
MSGENITDLRMANRDATMSDAELLDAAGARGGLVAEILGALKRSQDGADGAPRGPYAANTRLAGGRLIYAPTAENTASVQVVRAPILGGLAGW